MHSFLLIGQSNMAGRGYLNEARKIDKLINIKRLDQSVKPFYVNITRLNVFALSPRTNPSACVNIGHTVLQKIKDYKRAL